MHINNAIKALPTGIIFEKAQFAEIIRQFNPDYSDASVDWLLLKLKEENEIISVSRGKYVRRPADESRTIYKYSHSEEYSIIEDYISEEYPLVSYQMWEFVQFNEFVNHQISKNIFFVEVESMLKETIFEYLKEKYQDVLLSPTVDDFHRYKGKDNTIIVLKLISEAPKPNNEHSCVIEKLLVDLFTEKITGKLIPRNEYKTILEDSFAKYMIDEHKLFRYARRRHVETEIKSFIQNRTDIKLIQ